MQYFRNVCNNNEELYSIQSFASLIKLHEISFTGKKIGEGSFGAVHEDSWQGNDVAIKVVRLSTNNKYIVREIDLLDKCQHQNIISLKAVHVGYQEIFIVMKHFRSQNLRQLVFSENSRKLKDSDRLHHEGDSSSYILSA